MIYEDAWFNHELPLWSSNPAMAKSSDCTGSNSNLLVETWGFPIARFDSQRVQVNPDFHGLDPNCWFRKQTVDGWTDRQTDRSITSTPTHPQALTECTTEAYTMVSGVMPPVGPCVERRFCQYDAKFGWLWLIKYIHIYIYIIYIIYMYKYIYIHIIYMHILILRIHMHTYIPYIHILSKEVWRSNFRVTDF